MDLEAIEAAIQRLESEMGEWGSISMRLGDEYLNDIRALIQFVRQGPIERIGGPNGNG